MIANWWRRLIGGGAEIIWIAIWSVPRVVGTPEAHASHPRHLCAQVGTEIVVISGGKHASSVVHKGAEDHHLGIGDDEAGGIHVRPLRIAAREPEEPDLVMLS